MISQPKLLMAWTYSIVTDTIVTEAQGKAGWVPSVIVPPASLRYHSLGAPRMYVLFLSFSVTPVSSNITWLLSSLNQNGTAFSARFRVTSHHCLYEDFLPLPCPISVLLDSQCWNLSHFLSFSYPPPYLVTSSFSRLESNDSL